MLNRLRKDTEELHRRLEGDNLANKIMDHSINLEEYKLLLYQNYLAYSCVENELLKFLPGRNSEKSDKLRQDLLNLGFPNLNAGQGPDFKCMNEAEAIGAAYVIEGSAMGGMMIGKQVGSCSTLAHLPPQNFFSGERESMKGWNSYLKFLRSREFTDSEKEVAAQKAKETFRLFEKVFHIEFSETQEF